MNATSNSLHPYSILIEDDMRYTFTTSEGIVYHAYFLDYSAYLPQFSQIYMFNIEPEENKAHAIDVKISHTIVAILSKFFENHANTMIMVCDNLDGKEEKRNLLFDRWFKQYSTPDIEKFDASATTEYYTLYVSMFIHRLNPERTQIISAFYDLVKNNMYSGE